MKLLELIEEIENYKRVRRSIWKDKFLIRSTRGNDPLINCDFLYLKMIFYQITFWDLKADDWEVME